MLFEFPDNQNLLNFDHYSSINQNLRKNTVILNENYGLDEKIEKNCIDKYKTITTSIDNHLKDDLNILSYILNEFITFFQKIHHKKLYSDENEEKIIICYINEISTFIQIFKDAIFQYYNLGIKNY